MPATIHLYRHSRAAWREVVRPWLAVGGLQRSHIVVPTRGQAHAFKQQCIESKIPLLGVELLTPGLARARWLAHMETSAAKAAGLRPALGREFLLFGLREIVARRLAPLNPANVAERPAWGLLKSLQSDCERALGDFDDLLKSGFSAADFPEPVLREVFGELAAWVEKLGCDFAPRQTEQFVRGAARAPLFSGRLLIHGFSAEQRGEFFNVAAFARCFAAGSVTVTLPEPEFRGRKALDETWIELLEKTLGANAVPIDEPDGPPASCENVAEVWASSDGVVADETALWSAVAEGAPATGDTALSDEQFTPDAREAKRCRRFALPPHSKMAPPCVLVGTTRAAEMERVAEKISELLARGAENIGVVFPVSDAAHLRLVELLVERRIAFVDQLETAAPQPVEIQTQRALLAFHKSGCRLEELLALWPLLQAAGEAREQPLSVARDVCERLFDEHQTHALPKCAPTLLAGAESRAEWRDVAGVCVEKLLGANNVFVWPEQLTLADALARFSEACARLNLGEIPGGDVLLEFSKNETRVLPAPVVFSLLESFLPAQGAAADAPGRGCFARVTLTTRSRAEGGIWSHVIFTEANAGVWPERQEASCWLPDETRAALNKRRAEEGEHGDGNGGGIGIDLFTADDRAFLEKRGYASLARDTSEGIVFSAALFNEEEPELKLSPNGWLERVLWQRGGTGFQPVGLESSTGILPVGLSGMGDPPMGLSGMGDSPMSSEHGRVARATQPTQTTQSTQTTQPSQTSRAGSPRHFQTGGAARRHTGGSPVPLEPHGLEARATLPADWHRVWLARRDPATPFDEFFFCAAPKPLASVRLGVRQIEDGVSDPANLWFDAALKLGAIGWKGFERAPDKIRGQLAHRLLARALRGEAASGKFQRMPAESEARARLDAELALLRKTWPEDDAYWESFHMELSETCVALLKKIFAPGMQQAQPAREAGAFVAAEYSLPKDMRVQLDPNDADSRIRISGRMDLLRLDRPEFDGASVDIIDFKTGKAGALSAKAMGEKGELLQLGIYLEAARTLGAADGRVWLLKPAATDEPSSVSMEELPQALAGLLQIKRHLAEGRYGALTADRSEYAFGEGGWPLACAPIAHAVLAQKHEATFGETTGNGGGE